MATGVQLTNESAFALMQPSFINGVTDVNNNETFFVNMLDEHTGGSFDGSRLQFAIGVQRVASLRGVPQVGGNYPPAGTFNDKTGAVAQVFESMTVLFERQADIKTMGPHAFARASARAYSTALQHYKEEKERKALSNGSGILNILGGIGRLAAGTALTAQTPPVTAAHWQFRMGIWDAPKVREGMHIQFWNCATALNADLWRAATPRDYPTQGFYTVEAVLEEPATGTALITILEASPGTNSPAAATSYSDTIPGETSTNLDFIVVADTITEDNSGDAAGSKVNTTLESMGLDGIACGPNNVTAGKHGRETGVAWVQVNEAGGSMLVDLFQNISPVTVGKWNASIINATTYGSTLDRTMLQKAMTYQNVFGSRGTGEWACFIGHPAQINEYAQTLENGERYMIEGPTPASLPSGRPSLHQRENTGEALMFAGIPFYGSRFCRADRVYGLNRRGVKKKTLEAFTFGPIHDSYDNRIAKQMDGLGADNMLTEDRRCLMAIHNLAIPSAV